MIKLGSSDQTKFQGAKWIMKGKINLVFHRSRPLCIAILFFTLFSSFNAGVSFLVFERIWPNKLFLSVGIRRTLFVERQDWVEKLRPHAKIWRDLFMHFSHLAVCVWRTCIRYCHGGGPRQNTEENTPESSRKVRLRWDQVLVLTTVYYYVM